jgi:hypothetical protein
VTAPESVAGQNLAGAALVPSTNEICLATVDPTNNLVHLRRISPAGTVADFPTSTLPADGSVAVAADPGQGDVCAVAISTDTTTTSEVVIWSDPLAAPLLDQTVNGQVRSMAFTASDEIWVSAERAPNNSVITFKERETFAGGVNTGILDFTPTNSNMALVGPGTQPIIP